MRIRTLLFARRKLHLIADIASVDKNIITVSTSTCTSTVSISTKKNLRGSKMIPRTKQFQVDGLSAIHGGGSFQNSASPSFAPLSSSSSSSCSSSVAVVSKHAPLHVLFNDSDFIVVDKPHSLRMDGDGFDDSLQKRLIAQLGGSKDCFKWVHQLDFATSGVICVAKTRQAAAVAR
jgi:23S rRNA-/tRNA-specific pseudouridylate synthase